MGHSTASGAGSGAYADAVRRYSEVRDTNAARLERNPNNNTYRELAENYNDIVRAAQTMRANAKEYSGNQAAVAIENLNNEGAEIEITGNIFPGRYRLQTVRNMFNRGTSLAWVAQDARNHNHAFSRNMATIQSELGLIRGGRLTDDQEKKVRIIRK